LNVIKKPWGKEIIWVHNNKYAGKLLFINKGHRLSFQKHKYKLETVYSLKGKWQCEINGKRSIQYPESVITILPGDFHRFAAPYGPVVLIEVSTPQLGDIFRYEDDYGRL
jgi:quercetin dioxygenase-like cupin family protein